MARAMKRQAALLLGCLGLDKPHVRSGDRLADRLGVSGIVLLPLDVGLHIRRRHQAHRMPKSLHAQEPAVAVTNNATSRRLRYQSGRAVASERTPAHGAA